MKKRRVKFFNENAKVRRLNRERSVVSRNQNMFKESTFHAIFQYILQYMFTDNALKHSISLNIFFVSFMIF